MYNSIHNSDLAKTRELVIYVAEKLKECNGYGATLLNKALYFIDNTSYLQYKKPVSNFKYIKQDFGPTPAPNQLLSLKDNLISNGEAEEIKVNFMGLSQRKLIPSREADMGYFDRQEIELIDRVIESLSTHNATSISNYTHKFISWKIAKNNEDLPFFSYFLTSKIPSEKDITWASNIIKSYSN